MKAGSHCSSGPQVDSGVVIVACSVGGSLSDGLWPVCPFQTRTDAMSAVVASTCANGALICNERRYRTLIPDVDGSEFQAAVRCLFQVSVPFLVSIKISRGDNTSALQLRSPSWCPAAVAIVSRSIAVGLDIVVNIPTMA